MRSTDFCSAFWGWGSSMVAKNHWCQPQIIPLPQKSPRTSAVEWTHFCKDSRKPWLTLGAWHMGAAERHRIPKSEQPWHTNLTLVDVTLLKRACIQQPDFFFLCFVFTGWFPFSIKIGKPVNRNIVQQLWILEGLTGGLPKNGGYPKMDGFLYVFCEVTFPTKMDENWGVPLFWENSN